MFVRTASERDISAIRTLLVDTWHATYDSIYGADRVSAINDEWHSTEALRDRLTTPGSEFLVADNGKQIGGMAFASLDDSGKVVRLHQLYVRPDFQGRGIGGLMLDEVSGCFPGAEIMRIEVEAENTQAVDFYRTFGFVETDRTDNCGAPQSGIPALVFERSLS